MQLSSVRNQNQLPLPTSYVARVARVSDKQGRTEAVARIEAGCTRRDSNDDGRSSSTSETHRKAVGQNVRRRRGTARSIHHAG